MRRLVPLVLLLLGVAFVACSERREVTDGGATPATGETAPADPPTPHDTNGGGPGGVVRPPGVSLVTAVGVFPGGIGTYCWREATDGLCIDFVGPISNADPIELDSGERVEVEYGAGPPAEAHIAWYAVDGSAREVTASGDLLWTDHPPAFQEPVQRDSLVAPNAPGEYLVTIFAVYPGKGDAFYSFYVVVG